MSIEFRIDGLEDALRKIDEMKQGLTLPYLDFWCKRISNEVRLNTSDELGGNFLLEVTLSEAQNPRFDFRSPPELLEITINIIRKYLNEMPITTRALFKNLIKIIQSKKKESE